MGLRLLIPFPNSVFLRFIRFTFTRSTFPGEDWKGLDAYSGLKEVFQGEQLSLESLLPPLKDLISFYTHLDQVWDASCESVLVSLRLNHLHEVLEDYLNDVRAVKDPSQKVVPCGDLKSPGKSPPLVETEVVMARRITMGKSFEEPCEHWTLKLMFLQHQIIWLLVTLVLVGALHQFFYGYQSFPKWLQPAELTSEDSDSYEGDPFLPDTPPWWEFEFSDAADSAPNTIKHRRNLLEGPLVSHSFGDGISMHANQETRLSDFLFGLMIVEAFCVWLLSLYPPLAPHKKKIIGWGILSYSFICVLLNVVPFCQSWSHQPLERLPIASELTLPDFKMVDSERRETCQLDKEKNWDEMHPIYREVIRGVSHSPLDAVRKEILKHATRYNLYCFAGFRRSVQTVNGSGNPMQYELALGVAAESRKGMFTNVIPISKPLTLKQRQRDSPDSNVQAFVKEFVSDNMVYSDVPGMFRAMISMNLIRLITISVDGFQGVGKTPRFFVKDATMLAYSARRNRILMDKCFSVPQFWFTLAILMCMGLMFFFWNLWRFRRQLIASHVLKISFWSTLTLLVNSRYILPTVTLLFLVPMLTIILVFCKEFILLRRGTSWIFTKLSAMPEDCESLLHDSDKLDLLIARASGVMSGALCLHYIKYDSKNLDLFFSEPFQSADLTHKKLLGGRSLPSRRPVISEKFRSKFTNTWTDQNGVLSFPLGSPTLLTRFVLHNRFLGGLLELPGVMNYHIR